MGAWEEIVAGCDGGTKRGRERGRERAGGQGEGWRLSVGAAVSEGGCSFWGDTSGMAGVDASVDLDGMALRVTLDVIGAVSEWWG